MITKSPIIKEEIARENFFIKYLCLTEEQVNGLVDENSYGFLLDDGNKENETLFIFGYPCIKTHKLSNKVKHGVMTFGPNKCLEYSVANTLYYNGYLELVFRPFNCICGESTDVGMIFEQDSDRIYCHICARKLNRKSIIGVDAKVMYYLPF